ncbi:hypothetical protein ACFQU7_02960 [Pseudoroseomonas wenyumeiae]
MPLLQVKDLTVRFETAGGTVHAVSGVTYDLEPGKPWAWWARAAAARACMCWPCWG